MSATDAVQKLLQVAPAADLEKVSSTGRSAAASFAVFRTLLLVAVFLTVALLCSLRM